MRTREQVIRNFEAFCQETGVSTWQLGKHALGEPKFWMRLVSGNVTLSTIERVEQWADAYRAQSSRNLRAIHKPPVDRLAA